MASLANLPEIVGFFSYSREDDIDSLGALTALRDRIQRELRGRLGRTKSNFRLWQDTAAISHGVLWEEEIKSAIAQSVFFIPIITPTAVKSRHCKREFELFLAREAELGRRNLIFPLLYIQVPELEDEGQWRQNDVLRIIGARQYLNWEDRRYLDVNSPEVARHIGTFCNNIHNALRGVPSATSASSVRSPSAEAPQGPAHLAVEAPQGESLAAERGTNVDASRTPADPQKKDGPGLRGAIAAAFQFGLAALVLVLGVAVFLLWNQNPPPPSPSPPAPNPPVLPEPEYIIRKSQGFGGSGGAPFDDTAANPRLRPISRIDVTVTLNPANNNQRIIGRLQTQWGDLTGPLHGGGPRNVDTKPAQFSADEAITRVFIFHMDYSWARNETPPHWVSGLQIHTNKGFYNFGHTDGVGDLCSVASGDSLIGFFGRSGSYIDQLGCIFAKK